MKAQYFPWLVLSITLISCTDPDFSDLDEFFENKTILSEEAIQPLPETREYKVFAYRAAQVRSPFSIPPDPNEASRQPPVLSPPPDQTRRRDFLERFPLESLTMVGSLHRTGEIWCLVRDPEGGIHRVTKGSFVGLNHGKVVSATNTAVKIVEIVTDGTDGGWIKRPRSLNLKAF